MRSNLQARFLRLSLTVAVLSFAQSASAQYLPEFKEGETTAPIYNPYIPKSVQGQVNQGRDQAAEGQGSQQQSKASNSAKVIEQMGLGDKLMKDFVAKSEVPLQDRNKIDPNAPKRSDLLPLSVLPDDPIAYCDKHNKDNPPNMEMQAYMENYLHERIKPVGQMNLLIPKNCVIKVSDVAQKMLIDYSDYKRNELIARAANNKAELAKAAAKGNSLSRANLSYINYARSECKLARRDAVESSKDLLRYTEACVVQMLKRRIQQVSKL